MMLAVAALSAAALRAEEAKPIDGNWKVVTITPAADSAMVLIKVETKAGKPAGTVLSAARGLDGATVEDFKVEGGVVRLTVKMPFGRQSFEGRIDPKNPTAILGSIGEERFLQKANLTRTDKTEMTP